jgi:Tol biopolymer transport system component
MKRTFGVVTLLTIGIMTIVPGPTGAVVANTRRVSVRSNGNEEVGDSYTWKRALSQDGRVIAFESTAQLVGLDDDSEYDVFVHNMQTGRTEMVSVRSNGTPGADATTLAAEISANGRFVVFESQSENLVPNDDNESDDVFLHDRETGKTKRMSIRSNGNQAEGGNSQEASISPNGRYVAFTSAADNLVPNDDNLREDVFVRDRVTGKTRRVSVRSNGDEASANSERPSVADNGSVAFSSDAVDLVASDDNTSTDAFVHRLSTGRTRRVSIASDGEEGDNGGYEVTISRDGDAVSLVSGSSNFVNGAGGDQDDIFVHRISTGKTRLASKHTDGTIADGNSGAFQGALSYNGRYVTFTSDAENLVNNDDNGLMDMFWHDMKTGRTRLVSVPHNGQPLSHEAQEGSVSGDGRFVAFDSSATNIVPNDDNGSHDVFRRGPLH